MAAKKKKIESHKSEIEKKLAAAESARARIAADYANLERRVKEERQQLARHASAELLEKLFPVFDNFYRASLHAPNISVEDIPNLSEDDFKKIFNYFQGLRIIEKQMEAVLAEAGLQRIPTKGNLFDPTLHEAISYEPSTEVEADHVIDEVEAGWMLNGKVIRPAKVRVSQG